MASIGDTDTTTTTRSLMDTPAEVRQEILLLLNEDYPCFVSPSDRSWASWWMPYLRGRPQIMSPELVALRDCCKELKSHIDTLFPANKDKTVTTVYCPLASAVTGKWRRTPSTYSNTLSDAEISDINTIIVQRHEDSIGVDRNVLEKVEHRIPLLPNLDTLKIVTVPDILVGEAEFAKRADKSGALLIKMRQHIQIQLLLRGLCKDISFLEHTRAVQMYGIPKPKELLQKYKITVTETYTDGNGARLRVIFDANDNSIQRRLLQ